jgi:hypothetical protein
MSCGVQVRTAVQSSITGRNAVLPGRCPRGGMSLKLPPFYSLSRPGLQPILTRTVPAKPKTGQHTHSANATLPLKSA